VGLHGDPIPIGENGAHQENSMIIRAVPSVAPPCNGFEHTVVSADTRIAIEPYETEAAEHIQVAAPTSVDALTARLLAAQAHGSLAQQVRDVVQKNHAQALERWQ
jgi:hypothetical protein